MKVNGGMLSDVNEVIWFKLGLMISASELVSIDISLCDLGHE